MTHGRFEVLHVEVGGSYGGSQRALELYLAHTDQGRFAHDVLFYFPTPRMERLKPLARKVFTLSDMVPAGARRPARGAQGWLKTYLRGSALLARLNDLREWASLARSLPTVNRLSRIFRSGSYDLIHINNTFTYQAPTLLAAKRVGVKAIGHIRNPVRRNALSRWLLRRVDSVVTVNRTLEKELRSWGTAVDIRTCYDPMEPPSVDLSAACALRASLAPPGAILVGSVGRLEEQKGYRCLIEAAARVIQKRPCVHFAIAGEGPLRSLLQGLIDDLGLTDRFHLCGFREDVANFLAAVDLFVSSSLWEGGPLTLVEAMLLDKPVVATTVGVSSEVVVLGENGELVPPSDPQALATAILRALKKEDTGGYQQGRARGRLETLTNPGASARVFDEVLDRVAGGGIVFKSDHPTLRILTTHPKGFHPAWSARTVLLSGWLDAVRQTNGRPLNPWQSLYWGWKLFRASENFDVVVTGFERSWHVFAILQKLLRRKKTPHVLVYFFCGRLERPLQRRLKHWYYRMIAGACARIVVYSHRQIDLYVEVLDLPREKFACVPYHTTLDGYGTSVRADAFCVHEGDYIFSGGDFKDYATLLEAVRGLPCRTIIATRNKEYFRGLEVSENVEVTTVSHEEFFRLMAGARLFVLPLHGGVLHPGGEQSYLNAMAMGKPVVVAADFGADEYITQGVNGIIVPTGQSFALRDALLAVLESEGAAKEMGRAAREAAGRFSTDHFIKGVLAVVEECFGVDL